MMFVIALLIGSLPGIILSSLGIWMVHRHYKDKL